MTVEMFLGLLTAFSALTVAIVQGVKKILDEREAKYSSTLVACITALIVGIIGTAIYYIAREIPFTAINIIYMILMGAASSLGSTVGYDTIIKVVKQLAVL